MNSASYLLLTTPLSSLKPLPFQKQKLKNSELLSTTLSPSLFVSNPHILPCLAVYCHIDSFSHHYSLLLELLQNFSALVSFTPHFLQALLSWPLLTLSLCQVDLFLYVFFCSSPVSSKIQLKSQWQQEFVFNYFAQFKN